MAERGFSFSFVTDGGRGCFFGASAGCGGWISTLWFVDGRKVGMTSLKVVPTEVVAVGGCLRLLPAGGKEDHDRRRNLCINDVEPPSLAGFTFRSKRKLFGDRGRNVKERCRVVVVRCGRFAFCVCLSSNPQ
jgi:hypothetical protein